MGKIREILIDLIKAQSGDLNEYSYIEQLSLDQAESELKALRDEGGEMNQPKEVGDE